MTAQRKIIKCGDKSYYVQIFSDRDVLVRRDDTSIRGTGEVVVKASSYQDALAAIKADAGSGAISIRDY